MDEKKLVAKHFGTYNGGYPINGFGYIVDADLNNDGRINGEDHTIASLFSDEAVYDIESFEYDKNGNRTKLVQNGDTYTYQYGDRNRLEMVYVKKKDASTAKPYLKYAYDANGNTVERIAYTDKGEVKIAFEYDTLNRVVKTTEGGKSTEYLYDNSGNRFVKKGPEGTTLYLRHGQTSVAMDIEFGEAGIKGKINRYVLSGELLAGRITKEVKADGTVILDFSYYHLDHLNSTKCVSDEAGQVEVRYVYRAFGSQLAKIGSGEAKYTYGGKELDDGTNLYYFNARYYDAEVGRFISVDPAKDGGNWYVFCNNNPLRFVDPTGLKSDLTPTLNSIEDYLQDKTSPKSITIGPAEPFTIGPAPKEIKELYTIDLTPGNQNSAIGWDPDAPYKLLNRDAGASLAGGAFMYRSLLEYKNNLIDVRVLNGETAIKWALPGFKVDGTGNGNLDTGLGIKAGSQIDAASISVRIPLGLFDLTLGGHVGLGGKLQVGYIPGTDSFFKAGIACGPGASIGLSPPRNFLTNESQRKEDK